MHGDKLTVHMQTQIQDILPTEILKKRSIAGSCLYSKFYAVVTVLLNETYMDQETGKGEKACSSSLLGTYLATAYCSSCALVGFEKGEVRLERQSSIHHVMTCRRKRPTSRSIIR